MLRQPTRVALIWAAIFFTEFTKAAGDSSRNLFVIGDLALGSLQNRNIVLSALQNLSQATIVPDEEVLHFIDSHALFGTGIGYIDAHLLVAVRLSPGSVLWIRDKRLLAESARLGLCVNLTH